MLLFIDLAWNVLASHGPVSYVPPLHDFALYCCLEGSALLFLRIHLSILLRMLMFRMFVHSMLLLHMLSHHMFLFRLVLFRLFLAFLRLLCMILFCMLLQCTPPSRTLTVILPSSPLIRVSYFPLRPYPSS